LYSFLKKKSQTQLGFARNCEEQRIRRGKREKREKMKTDWGEGILGNFFEEWL
jgi:hypothetical protein